VGQSERIHVIDCAFGQIRIQRATRDGFQELVSEVALNKAGFVMGPGISTTGPRKLGRLARLLELCALTATLILDEDGIYDPRVSTIGFVARIERNNERAECISSGRGMRGGRSTSAARRKLEIGPPVGLEYRPYGTLDLDPDAGVQAALCLVFDTFDRLGSARGQFGFFLHNKFSFRAVCARSQTRRAAYGLLPYARILQVLHRSAIRRRVVYGRNPRPHSPARRLSDQAGRWRSEFVSRAFIRHIDWERFKANQEKLAGQRRAYGIQRRAGRCARDPGLLQGRVLCGLSVANGRSLQRGNTVG